MRSLPWNFLGQSLARSEAAGRDPQLFAFQVSGVSPGKESLSIRLEAFFAFTARGFNTVARARLRSFLSTFRRWRSFACRHYSIIRISHSSLSFPTPAFPSIPIAIPTFILASNLTTSCAATKTGASMVLLS